MDLTHVDTKVVISGLTTIIATYVYIRVMLADFKARIQHLEREVKENQTWQGKMADALHELAVVLGKVEQRMDNLDKNVGRLQDRRGD